MVVRGINMKVILLDNIKKLGSIGSKIEVKPGYARNYLIPQSKAILATIKNIEFFKKQKNILQSKIIEKKIQSESSAKAINDIKNITIIAKSSIRGKLFGSVGSKDIAALITKSVGFKVSRTQIRLPNNDALKFVGIYNIKVHVYDKIFANLTITVLNQLENDEN